MIFVTVGTWKFDDLIETIDQAIGDVRIDEEVVMQIGNGAYKPKYCEYFCIADSLESYIDRADIIVTHGGTGTILEVLKRGLKIIGVSNPKVQDKHQQEFLEALEKEGCVIYCRDLQLLPELIQKVNIRPLKAIDINCFSSFAPINTT